MDSTYLPWAWVFHMDLFPMYFFLEHQPTLHLTLGSMEMNEGVRDQIARTLREFGFTPKGHARSYEKLYLEYFDMIPYPQGFRVPDLAKFTGDVAKPRMST
jgi:hypothetical protein